MSVRAFVRAHFVICYICNCVVMRPCLRVNDQPGFSVAELGKGYGAVHGFKCVSSEPVFVQLRFEVLHEETHLALTDVAG